MDRKAPVAPHAICDLVIEVFQAEPSRGFGRDGEEGYVVWKGIGNIAALVGVLVAMVMMFNQVDGRLDCMHERMDRMDRTQAETNARFDAVLEAIVSFDRRGRRVGMRSRRRIGGRGLRPLRTPHLAAKRGLMMRLTSHQLRGNRPFRGFRWGVL